MVSCYEKSMKTMPYLPFNMGGCLTEAMIAEAEQELGETEDVKAKTVRELKRLVQGITDLDCPTDDAYLVQYLRARKFNVQKTLSLLKNACEVKRCNRDIYCTFNKEALKRAFDQKVVFILPHRDEKGSAIVVIRMGKWDVDVVNASEAITALTVAFLMCAHEPATQVCGIRVLIDAQGCTLRQIKSLTSMKYLLLLAKGLKNSFPIRFKGIHVYNESTVFQYFWSFLKLFLTEKIKNRFHLHGDSQESLHKFIPKAILPVEDYGGDNPSDVAAWFNAEVEEHYFEIYRQITNYGYRQ